jgi:hypothetical protein
VGGTRLVWPEAIDLDLAELTARWCAALDEP